MPEMHFRVRWPNGAVETCYSPSLVIKDFFQPGASYPLADFLARSRTALKIASDRPSKPKYGFLARARFGHSPASRRLRRSWRRPSEADISIESFEE